MERAADRGGGLWKLGGAAGAVFGGWVAGAIDEVADSWRELGAESVGVWVAGAIDGVADSRSRRSTMMAWSAIHRELGLNAGNHKRFGKVPSVDISRGHGFVAVFAIRSV